MTDSEQEALRIVAAFQGEIQKLKTDQETRRDQLAVLIAGGALTASFAFVPSLLERTDLILLWALVISWVFWAGALIGSLIGYTVSIGASHHALQRLSNGQTDWETLYPGYHKWIEPLNLLVIALVVSGFLFFGIFSYGNLRHANEANTKSCGRGSQVDTRDRSVAEGECRRQSEGESSREKESIPNVQDQRDVNAGSAGGLARAEETEVTGDKKVIHESATMPVPPQLPAAPQQPQPTPQQPAPQQPSPQQPEKK